MEVGKTSIAFKARRQVGHRKNFARVIPTTKYMLTSLFRYKLLARFVTICGQLYTRDKRNNVTLNELYLYTETNTSSLIIRVTLINEVYYANRLKYRMKLFTIVSKNRRITIP